MPHAEHPQSGPEHLAADAPTSPAGASASALTAPQKEVILAIFAGFYRQLSGQWHSTLLVDIWQGPNAIMVSQLDMAPMQPAVAKSIINILMTITQAHPQYDTSALTASGALEALYDIAFGGGPRLDLLSYAALPLTELNDEEARAWVRCCITLGELAALPEPVVIRTERSVHLFDFAALKQAWKDGYRFINPMTRKPVLKSELMRLRR